MIALLLCLLPLVFAQWNNYQSNTYQQPYPSNGQYQNNNNFNGGAVYQEGDGGVPVNGGYQQNNWNNGPVYDESGRLISGGQQVNNNNWNGANGPVYDESGRLISGGQANQPNSLDGRYSNQMNNNNYNNNQFGSNGFNQPIGGAGWETITSTGYGSVPMELAWRAARQEINQNNFGQQMTTNPLIPTSIVKAQKNMNDVEMEVVYAEGNCFGARTFGGQQIDLSLISSTNCVQKPLGQRALYSVSERQGRRGGSKITVRKLRDVASGEVIVG